MNIEIVAPEWIDLKRGYPALQAFADGLRHLGLKYQLVSIDKARPGKKTVLVCWGVYKERFKSRFPFKRLQDQQKKARGDLIIIERGFVRRENHYLVGWDNLNGRARFPHKKDVPSDRWKLLETKLQPWQNQGNEIMVMGQVPWDTSCQHIDMQSWVKGALRILAAKFPDNRITFRPHPLQPQAIDPGYGIRLNQGPLDQAFARAKLVVTFSSTSGVDALIAGLPVIACDPISMVYDICPNDFEITSLPRPDRKEWANWLAYCQWTFKEMREGLPWKHFYGE